MKFPLLDVPKEWVSGKEKNSVLAGGFCSSFPKHLLWVLLVWKAGPESPFCTAAPILCASFPDDNHSCVPAATAGI